MTYLRALHPPQEKSPVGEVHDEMGIVSFDTTRGLFVLRQFHGEGFVNQHSVTALSPITFETEALENAPDGWRAREIYLFDGRDSFLERFELAAPGKDYDIYSENHLTRVG